MNNEINLHKARRKLDIHSQSYSSKSYGKNGVKIYVVNM